MGHRKNNGRSSAYGQRSQGTQGQRGTSIGVRALPSSQSLRPLSHSSPVRQSIRPRRSLWGSGGIRNNYNANEDRPLPCSRIENCTWNRNFGHNNKSPTSLSFGSDGGRSFGSDSGSINSPSNGSTKYSNSGSVKKSSVPRLSNPLRYKTELCRSFEESGDCRFGESCTFAHGLRELRAVLRHPRYKTDLCRTYHGAGYCQYGARCHFVHDLEEAAGVTPMRVFRQHSCPNGLDRTVLTMSENCNVISPRLNANDILSNLERLRTYKAAEERLAFLNSSSYGNDQFNSMGKLSPEFLSLNMLTIGQDNLSGLTSGSQTLDNFGLTSGSRSLDNFWGTSDDHSESISVNYMDMKALGNEDHKVGRSTASHDADWWDIESELSSLYSIPYLDGQHSSSAVDTWRLGEASVQSKTVIENPMEVSRSLLIPSITELIHMP